MVVHGFVVSVVDCGRAAALATIASGSNARRTAVPLTVGVAIGRATCGHETPRRGERTQCAPIVDLPMNFGPCAWPLKADEIALTSETKTL